MPAVHGNRMHGGRLDEAKLVKLSDAAGIPVAYGHGKRHLEKGMSRPDSSPRILREKMRHHSADASAGWTGIKQGVRLSRAVYVAVRGTMDRLTHASPTVTTLLTLTRIATTTSARDLSIQPLYDEARGNQFI